MILPCPISLMDIGMLHGYEVEKEYPIFCETVLKGGCRGGNNVQLQTLWQKDPIIFSLGACL